jgi:transglutaminase-like putative cysteine protease
MPLLTVRHVTTYTYKQAVAFGEHRVMFRPRDSYDQRLLSAELTVTPQPMSMRWMHDVMGNCVNIVCFDRRAKLLRFESVIRLDHEPDTGLEFPISPHAERYPFSYEQEDMPDLLRSMERQFPDREGDLSRWARQFTRDGRGTLDLLTAMTHTIRQRFTYVARHEHGIQEPLRTLKLQSGSCRDFAVLMMEAVRALGFAARFVSGYLYVPPRGGETRVGGGSTHAWVQVYLPGAGWTEFDPTNGIVGNRDLIRVAVARDPSHAVPLSGTWIGFPADNVGMTVDVQVTAEPAEPTQPARPAAMQAHAPA